MASDRDEAWRERITNWLFTLQVSEVSPVDFILQYLSSTDPDHISTFSTFASNPSPVLDFLVEHPLFDPQVRNWVMRVATEILVSDLQRLSNKDSAFHLPLKSVSKESLSKFDLDNTASEIERQAPHLWSLVRALFNANHKKRAKKRRERVRMRAERVQQARREVSPTVPNNPEDVEMDVVEDDSDEQWEDVDELIPEVEQPSQDSPEDVEDQIEERHQGIMKMRAVTCVSIMMQSANMRCNSFQMATGTFLQAANAPETVCELLSRVGFCTSITTINGCSTRLSHDAEDEIRAQGRTFLNVMAFDNLDFEVKSLQPTVENPHANLVHLTTATMLPLHPEIVLEDIDCADEVWRHSPFNNQGDHSRANVPLIKLMKIHEEQGTLPPNDLTRRQRFNKWKFLHDLVHFGPEYFKKFKRDVGKPETVEAIPMAKTHPITSRWNTISGPIESADVPCHKRHYFSTEPPL